ncbi:hypothetical protein Bbelb_182860 [Branchiostoma belcheri]|nr:hypothetical protein Bbelb_182860 [Branchiostoma belcheri]
MCLPIMLWYRILPVPPPRERLPAISGGPSGAPTGQLLPSPGAKLPALPASLQKRDSGIVVHDPHVRPRREFLLEHGSYIPTHGAIFGPILAAVERWDTYRHCRDVSPILPYPILMTTHHIWHVRPDDRLVLHMASILPACTTWDRNGLNRASPYLLVIEPKC